MKNFPGRQIPARTYAHAFLGIGCGVTISGPHIVGPHDVRAGYQVQGDKVLEIGTGSGYQAAMLSYLTPNVYSIEIIPQLAAATDRIYTQAWPSAKYVGVRPYQAGKPPTAISAGRNMRPSTRSS